MTRRSLALVSAACLWLLACSAWRPGIYSQHEGLWVLDAGEAPSSSNLLIEYDHADCSHFPSTADGAKLDERVCEHMVGR